MFTWIRLGCILNHAYKVSLRCQFIAGDNVIYREKKNYRGLDRKSRHEMESSPTTVYLEPFTGSQFSH